MAEARDGCDGKVGIYETRRSSKGASLAIQNHCHVPLTVEVHFHSLLNLEPDRERPIRVVLEAGQKAPLVELRVIQPRSAWRYGTGYEAIVGHGAATHDDTVRYAFPFGGSEPRLCAQGPHDKPSHHGIYAYDFEMPVGTPVVAARAGVVFHTVDGFSEEGTAETAQFLERANVVIVLHDDDTTATYAHLRPGVVVSEGDRVAVGQLLGYSGNSGYSSGPHLHFEVDVPMFGRPDTVPILFVGDTLPSRGSSYAPTPVAAR